MSFSYRIYTGFMIHIWRLAGGIYPTFKNFCRAHYLYQNRTCNIFIYILSTIYKTFYNLTPMSLTEAQVVV